MRFSRTKWRMLSLLLLGLFGFVGYKAYKYDDGVIRTYGTRNMSPNPVRRSRPTNKV